MLSSRAKYATRALLDLSLLYRQGPVQIQDIATRQAIPLKFLQQILFQLKLAGFVQSRKGPGGGYVLSRSPDEISLGAVVRAMDGPIAPISCVSVTQFQECGCPDPETCPLRIAFRKVRDAVALQLDGTSFGELRDMKIAGEASYSLLNDYVI